MRRFRFKKVAVFALFLSIIFYYGSILSEIYLSQPKNIESFDYLYEIDDRYKNADYDGFYYYDSQTNQLMIGEDVYDAKYIPNDQYIGGIKRIALIAGEVVNPLANIHRFGFDMEGVTAVWITLLYILKSIVLFALVGYSHSKEQN